MRLLLNRYLAHALPLNVKVFVAVEKPSLKPKKQLSGSTVAVLLPLVLYSDS